MHFTWTIHGEVEAGPNAVLAFAREGYRFGRVNLAELADTLGYRGFWAMTRRHWRMGVPAGLRPVPDTDRRAFHRSLTGYAPTPLVTLPALAAELGVGDVWSTHDRARPRSSRSAPRGTDLVRSRRCSG